MCEILEQIGKIGIVPVIKIEDLNNAVPLAKALCNGGIPVAEITFRASGADRAMKAITDAVPEMLVGAGTVLTIEQVDLAIAAGAKFIVSPGFNPRIVKYCKEKNILITPGCSTPSDIEQAIELGLNVVKFFPAEQSGGLEKIKAMSAPYHQMMFMPTGGINEKNLNEYLASTKIIACGGSWMVKEELINQGNFDEITRLTKNAISAMLGFELAHIGINCINSDEASKVCADFQEMFGFISKEGNSSVFAGTFIEATKSPYKGVNGHIAIKTNSIERAIYSLQSKGFAVDYETSKYNAKGKLVAIYLNAEISGFAIHLLQK